MNKPLGVNPKDRQAAKKCDLSLFPDIAVYHGALVMTDGAGKYGPYNWRDKAVLARVYIAAASRHLKRWAAGEELTTDSKVHNLGAVIACCAILLDAQTTGNLGDDRAKSPEVLALMDELDSAAKALGEKHKAAKADVLVELPKPALSDYKCCGDPADCSERSCLVRAQWRA